MISSDCRKWCTYTIYDIRYTAYGIRCLHPSAPPAAAAYERGCTTAGLTATLARLSRHVAKQLLVDAEQKPNKSRRKEICIVMGCSKSPRTLPGAKRSQGELPHSDSTAMLLTAVAYAPVVAPANGGTPLQHAIPYLRTCCTRHTCTCCTYAHHSACQMHPQRTKEEQAASATREAKQ